MKHRVWIAVMVIALVLSMQMGLNSAFAADEAMLKELKEIIEKQQKAIDELERKVDALSKQKTPEAATVAEAAVPAGGIKSSGDKVAVKIYGHVNRAAMSTNDGDSTNYYFVDNNNSQSRIGFTGDVKVNENMAIGSKIEMGYGSNLSSKVDQKNKSVDSGITLRHVDFFLADKRYGKLYLGQGSTASDGTAEVDLSGTSNIGYSAIADMAGGQLFYSKTSSSLSSTTIGKVFNNMDGARDDRIRYDSPKFFNMQASGSIHNGDGGDLVLNYSTKFGDTKVAAAGAWALPGDQNTNVDKQLIGSASVLLGMGLNFTVAGGLQDMQKARSGDEASYFYSKVGYRTSIFSFGETAASIDYGLYKDIAVNGDDADTVGVQLVQYFDPWATEWYFGYRYHALDRKGSNFDDINAVMTGFRLKF